MISIRIAAVGIASLRYSLRSAWLGGVSLAALLLTSGQGDARNLNSNGTVVPTAAAALAAAAAAQQGATAGVQAQV
ncbi:MAG: hypothetical protein WCD42_08835, partial [Rhizomicrobium sp.]